MDPKNADRLRRELVRWCDPDETDPDLRRQLAGMGWNRISEVFDLLPPGTSSSRLLELGSGPFVSTVALDLAWPGEIVRANYYGTAERHGTQRLVEVNGPGEKLYPYDLFNVESDVFPYPDASFDVVFFCELVEHLAVNPVWTMAEIHRVLRPGGHVIVSTPNAMSIDRVLAIFRGETSFVDRYFPLYGYGGRHNREYLPDDLRELLETGFATEVFTVRDLKTHPFGPRAGRAALKLWLRAWSRQPRGDHLFARARRRPAFRWHFSPRLFSGSHMLIFARHPWVEVGQNDSIQCTMGWGPIESAPDGTFVRRVHGTPAWPDRATAIVAPTPTGRTVRVRYFARSGTAPIRLQVVVQETGGEMLSLVYPTIPVGAWADVCLPMSRPAAPDRPLAVSTLVASPGDVTMQRIELV